MKQEIAQLFYDSDTIQIKTGEFNLDFTRIFSSPYLINQLVKYCAKELDDYAIDSLICIDEALPFIPPIATELELPFQWLRDGKISATKEETKRAIFFSLLQPGKEDSENIKSIFEKNNIELIGIYSLLGVHNEETSIRHLSLIKLSELFEIYHSLYLITNEEFSNLSKINE